MRKQMKELKDSIEKVNTNLTSRVEEIRTTLENKHGEIVEKIEYIEKRIKRNNVVIFGLETNNYYTENLVQIVLAFFETKLNILVAPHEINNIYSVGRTHKKPIVVEFISYLRKIDILKSAHKLKGTNIFINHDLTKTEQKENTILRKQLKLARTEDTKAYIKKNKLYYQGEVYTAKDFPEDSSEIITNETVEEKSSSAPATPVTAGRPIPEPGPKQTQQTTTLERKHLRSNSNPRNKDGKVPIAK